MINCAEKMFHFYVPWKHQETSRFLLLSGKTKKEHWPEMINDIVFFVPN